MREKYFTPPVGDSDPDLLPHSVWAKAVGQDREPTLCIACVVGDGRYESALCGDCEDLLAEGVL